MKKTFKTLFALIVCLALVLSVSISALAATATISLGYSGSLNPGKTITVNITVTSSADLYSYDAIVQYDISYLQLVSTSDGITNAEGSFVINPTSKTGAKKLTATVQFKLLNKTGNTTVRVLEGAAGDGTTEGIVVAAKNLSFSIVAPTKSSDNTLKSIEISAGTLSPAFSKNVTEYKVTVPYSVNYFSIDGYKNHSGATVSYSTGDKGPNIKVGTTVRTITVTAENGAVKKYNITVTRLPEGSTSSTSSADTSSTTSAVEPEENKLETSVDGNKMIVSEIIPDDVSVPGFLKGEYTFNAVHVPALLDKDGNVVLLYLLDEENKGALYRYDSATGLFKKPLTVTAAKVYTVVPVTLANRDQILIDTENVFNLSTVTIDEQEVAAYVYKDEKLSDFAVVCAINEEGEKGFYRYDKVEGTLQRYVAEYRDSENTNVTLAAPVLNDTIVVISCAAACIVAIIAIIIIWAVRRKRFLEEFDNDFDEDEPLFVKETDFDENEEVENFDENAEEGEKEEINGENDTQE